MFDFSARAVVEATLGSLLPIKSLTGIVADYSYGHCSRLFAEELYYELWEGKTDLLVRELYDSEESASKAPHGFWVYLSGGMQRVVAFVHMLWETRHKHRQLKDKLASFAKLVSKKVPRMAYFVGCYLDDSVPFSLDNVSFDEWPQALIDDQKHFAEKSLISLKVAAGVQYLLMHRNEKRLKGYLGVHCCSSSDFAYMFYILCAVEPALLRKFFDIGFTKDSDKDLAIFKWAAPVAMRMDPKLSSALSSIAKQNGWDEPVAEETGIGEELADHGQAGGSVHMQPLMPVAQSLDAHYRELWHGASSTGKTVFNANNVQLFIAADNVLL